LMAFFTANVVYLCLGGADVFKHVLSGNSMLVLCAVYCIRLERAARGWGWEEACRFCTIPAGIEA